MPLTPRGGGTGNYGQAVPLQGGVAARHHRAVSRSNGRSPAWCASSAGAKMLDIDAATRPNGWELRMHPSTKRTATIGGFVAGGSGGVGSVTYGGLREPGNILAARVVTVEETPRVLELRGDAAQKVNRAYGTTGIITALEMPLAPAWPWIDVIVAFDDFIEAVQVGHDDRAGRRHRQEAAVADRTGRSPTISAAQAGLLPRGQEPADRHDRRTVAGELQDAARHARHDHLEQPDRREPGKVPLYEYTWNHTTLQVLKTDRGVTYLQCLYPHDRLADVGCARWQRCSRTRCCRTSSSSASAAG